MRTFVGPSTEVLPHGCYFNRKRKAGESDRKLPLWKTVHLCTRNRSVSSYNTRDIINNFYSIKHQTVSLFKDKNNTEWNTERKSPVYIKPLNLWIPLVKWYWPAILQCIVGEVSAGCILLSWHKRAALRPGTETYQRPRVLFLILCIWATKIRFWNCNPILIFVNFKAKPLINNWILRYKKDKR